jgi:hypothetical protein
MVDARRVLFVRQGHGRLQYEGLAMAAKVRAGEQFEMCGEKNMTADQELHKKVRDAIFLAALGSWEESCTFEELSEDGQQVYDGYASEELHRNASELAQLRANLEQIADSILSATRASREGAAVATGAELEYAGCDAIAALRAVSGNPGLSDAQHALVAGALLGMFAAKSRWLSRPAVAKEAAP